MKDGLERALRLLKQPRFRALAENVDTIIIFRDGKYAGSIKGKAIIE